MGHKPDVDPQKAPLVIRAFELKASGAPSQIVVPFIQGDPSNGLPELGDQFAQKGGFAKSGRAGEQDETAWQIHSSLYLFDQPRASGWNVEFGGEQWNGHPELD
jgi:hypothetical protein